MSDAAAFAISVDGARDIGDNWMQVAALCDGDFQGWRPADLCQKRANTLDPAVAK